MAMRVTVGDRSSAMISGARAGSIPETRPGGRTMGKVHFEISMSLDGYVAGPNQSPDEPLGEGGEELHEWVVRLPSWQEKHGRAPDGPAGPEDELVEKSVEATGATVMGRRMFGGG